MRVRARLLLSFFAGVMLIDVDAVAQVLGLDPQCASPAPEVGRMLPDHRLVCGMSIESFPGEVRSGFSGTTITLAVDRDGGVVGLLKPNPSGAWVPRRAEAAGSHEDTIFWGRWTSGMARTFAADVEVAAGDIPDMPYVGGAPARSVPNAVATYSLLGTSGVLSGRNSDGGIVMPGAVQAASLRVDFQARQAELRLSYIAAGAMGTLSMQLRQRGRTSALWEPLECNTPMACPEVELKFYGSGGRYAGILFRLRHDQHMAQPAWVASRLANVWASGSIALQRD
jgi:hypothetical protein